MLRHTRVERIGGEHVFAGEQVEALARHDEVEVAAEAAAHRAVALDDVDRGGGVDLEAHAAAVAAAAVPDHG